MKIKLLAVAFTMIIIGSSFGVTAIINVKSCENKLNNFTTTHILKEGWLEEHDGVTILYVNGSHYEMGYQHGYFLKDECLENIRAFLSYSEKIGFTKDYLLDIWAIMNEFVPNEYIEEMQGICNGSGVKFEDISAVYSFLDAYSLFSCFGMSAWNTATENNKLVQVRSCELPFNIKDPVSGKFAHENNVLFVRKPDDSYASLIPSVAAFLNCGGGINEEGIGFSNQISWSKDISFEGMPIKIREQIILDKCSNLEEVINIIIKNQTLGCNYIISDGKISTGKAVEITSNYSYISTWNDDIESKNPFWSIDHVVRRTNFFIEPDIAKTQRNRYHPGGIIGFLKLIYSVITKDDDRFDSGYFFPIWRLYKTMSKEIDKNWGKINLENTMSMFKDVYNGKTDFLLKIMGIASKGTGFLESWNQWVACPETGDMLVSFASTDDYASKNPIHQFNLFELLES